MGLPQWERGLLEPSAAKKGGYYLRYRKDASVFF